MKRQAAGANRDSALPMRCRLPNPPAVFVGRETELAQVAASLERGPVCVILGRAGAGKSALARLALQRSFPERFPQALHVPIKEGRDPASCVIAVLRTAGLGGAGGRGDMALIDLADTQDCWMVLEDFHLAEAQRARALLASVARYARRSRWLVTTQVDPAVPELAGQLCTLGALSSAEQLALARALAPKGSQEEWAAAIALAAGSPQRLELALRGQLQSTPNDTELDIPRGALPLVQTLALLERPLSLDAARGLCKLPGQRSLDQLAGRGVLQSGALGLSLDAGVKQQVRRSLSDTALRRRADRAATALATSNDASLQLEALRIRLVTRSCDRALELLDDRGESLIAAGHGAAISEILEGGGSRQLEGWRLRAAVGAGDPVSLSRQHEPIGRAPELRMLWARVLFERGELDRAAAECEALAQSASPTQRFEAALLRSRSHANQGQLADALRCLEQVQTPGPLEAVRLGTLAANYLAFAGDHAGAVARLSEVDDRVDALRGPRRAEVLLDVVNANLRLARHRRAEAVLDSLEGGSAQRRAYLRAVVHLVRGRLEQCRDALDALEAHVGGPALPRAFFAQLDCSLRLFSGDLRKLDTAVDALISEGLRSRSAPQYYPAVLMRARLQLAYAEPEAPAEDASNRPRAVPPYDSLVGLHALQLQLRHGLQISSTRDWPTEPPRHGFPEPRVMFHVVHAEAALAVDDHQLALREARAAQALASRLELWWLELEAGQLLLEVLCLSERWSELEAAARRQQEHAHTLGARRARSEAQFFAAPRLTPGALDTAAGLMHLAPVAARRAQALMGGQPALDQLDGKILDALRRRDGAFAVHRVNGEEGEGWETGWGLDERDNALWLPDGQSLQLSSPLSWRILRAVADAGGAASKESLVKRVWGIDAYHSLRHDNRLQVAVRKLRDELEEDRRHPRRLVTTDDGYEFGRELPVRRVMAEADVQPRSAERSSRPSTTGGHQK